MWEKWSGDRVRGYELDKNWKILIWRRIWNTDCSLTCGRLAARSLRVWDRNGLEMSEGAPGRTGSWDAEENISRSGEWSLSINPWSYHGVKILLYGNPISLLFQHMQRASFWASRRQPAPGSRWLTCNKEKWRWERRLRTASVQCRCTLDDNYSNRDGMFDRADTRTLMDLTKKKSGWRKPHR